MFLYGKNSITTVITSGDEGIAEAVRLLRAGDIVAFPTETVYGLGADALNPGAVRRVFEAKGRPADNPLIAHISSVDDWRPLVKHIDARALALAEAFWPGPLTIVLPRSPAVPDEATAGLDTIGVRMPAHPLALELIARAGMPVAAPSANRSGKPSPTDAAAVLDDMAGRIPLILDGGSCSVGLESTVISLATDPPVLLRPGAVTPDELRPFLPGLTVHPSALAPLGSGTTVASPGMKYAHYAPNAQLTLATGTLEEQRATLMRLYDDAEARGGRPVLLASDDTIHTVGRRRVVSLGPRGDARVMAHRLFSALREIDSLNATHAFGETFEAEGVGLAMMNRLLRAAGYRVTR